MYKIPSSGRPIVHGSCIRKISSSIFYFSFSSLIRRAACALHSFSTKDTVDRVANILSTLNCNIHTPFSPKAINQHEVDRPQRYFGFGPISLCSTSRKAHNFRQGHSSNLTACFWKQAPERRVRPSYFLRRRVQPVQGPCTRRRHQRIIPFGQAQRYHLSNPWQLDHHLHASHHHQHISKTRQEISSCVKTGDAERQQLRRQIRHAHVRHAESGLQRRDAHLRPWHNRSRQHGNLCWPRVGQSSARRDPFSECPGRRLPCQLRRQHQVRSFWRTLHGKTFPLSSRTQQKQPN